jgi:acyl-CoA hydrolase
MFLQLTGDSLRTPFSSSPVTRGYRLAFRPGDPAQIVSATLAPRPVSASQAEMLELVLPSDANLLGNMLGGRVMHHMDMCAAVAAQRHSGHVCVTASVDRIDFRSPVKIGELLVLKSSVNFAGRTSMEVGVLCMAEDARTGMRRHTASAYFTFVALGEDGRPTPVPPARPDSPVEQRRFEAARRRRDARVATRKDDA